MFLVSLNRASKLEANMFVVVEMSGGEKQCAERVSNTPSASCGSALSQNTELQIRCMTRDVGFAQKGGSYTHCDLNL